MFSFTSSRSQLGLFYGYGNTDKICRFEKVVLQPGAHSAEELRFLKSKRVTTLAYLSLSQDSGPKADWHSDESDPEWGSNYVLVDHPLWASRVINQAEAALELGFSGLFLDTLDVDWKSPQYVAPLLSIVRRLRLETNATYILANRGFGLLPALGLWVDGLLFESFSVRWGSPTSEILPEAEQLQNDQLVDKSWQYGLDMYSLDYADTRELKEFARKRAKQHGLVPSFGNKDLSQIVV
jgi:polysaccharide biosynthesis protein PelA